MSEVGNSPLDQSTQSPIQAGLAHIQGWGVHNLSEGVILTECYQTAIYFLKVSFLEWLT